MSSILDETHADWNAAGVGAETAIAAPVFDSEVAPCFYHWREMYPELEILYNNINIIKEEAKSIGQVSESIW